MNFNKYKNISKQYDVVFSKTQYRKNLKRLQFNKPKSLGRSQGSIVMWHKGGGVKRNFRSIFDYTDIGSKYLLLRSIEYDPNRSAFIGLGQTQEGVFLNIVVSSNSKIGDVI